MCDTGLIIYAWPHQAPSALQAQMMNAAQELPDAAHTGQMNKYLEQINFPSPLDPDKWPGPPSLPAA